MHGLVISFYAFSPIDLLLLMHKVLFENGRFTIIEYYFGSYLFVQVGRRMHVCIIRIDEATNNIIISEKEAWVSALSVSILL